MALIRWHSAGKEGQFTKRMGAITLKLIGDVQPASVIGIKQKIIHDDPYMYRAKDVAEQVAGKIRFTFRTSPEHVKCYKHYKVRGSYEDGKEKCTTRFGDYKERLKTFMYTQEWIDFLVSELSDSTKYALILGTPSP